MDRAGGERLEATRNYLEAGAGARTVILVLVAVALGIVVLAGFLLLLAMVVFILLLPEDFLTRKGRFGGDGAEMVWPVPPAR